MGDSLLMPINGHAKFDTTSFALGAEIRNRTNKPAKNTQTVNDISTPYLWACVNNEHMPIAYSILA